MRTLIPNDTWRELKRIAASRGVAASAVVAHAVDAWLEANHLNQDEPNSAPRGRQRRLK